MTEGLCQETRRTRLTSVSNEGVKVPVVDPIHRQGFWVKDGPTHALQEREIHFICPDLSNLKR